MLCAFIHTVDVPLAHRLSSVSVINHSINIAEPPFQPHWPILLYYKRTEYNMHQRHISPNWLHFRLRGQNTSHQRKQSALPDIFKKISRLCFNCSLFPKLVISFSQFTSKSSSQHAGYIFHSNLQTCMQLHIIKIQQYDMMMCTIHIVNVTVGFYSVAVACWSAHCCERLDVLFFVQSN